MISDSPPDRELEWTDEGIQSSKNLIHRLEKYFSIQQTEIDKETKKRVERFAFNMESNISDFSLNKCVAEIYTLLNYLERNKVYLQNSELSKKIIICLFPILPGLCKSISLKLFDNNIFVNWPRMDEALLFDDEINLPIQIQGKLVTTINTKKGYLEENILNQIYQLDKMRNKISGKEVLKVINVQDKIINIITK